MLLLSVSDFQGFESYRPSAKINLPSLPFDNIITIISSQPLPCRRRSLTSFTFLFLVLLRCFCQLGTATPFGSRHIHSFDCRSFNNTTFSARTTTFSATSDTHTTSSLLYSGPASTYWHRWYYYARLFRLIAVLRSFVSLLVERDSEAQRFSPLHLQEILF